MCGNDSSRHIKEITGHKSEAIIESYSDTPTFLQFKAMSNVIADFVDSGHSSGDPSAILAKHTEKAVMSSSGHSTLAPPQKNNFVEIQQAQQNNQHLAHGLIPGGTFHGCTFNFTINLPGSSAQQNA